MARNVYLKSSSTIHDNVRSLMSNLFTNAFTETERKLCTCGRRQLTLKFALFFL